MKKHLISSMNRIHLFTAIFALLISGCAGSKYGSANKNEDIAMRVENASEVINLAMLNVQTPTLASRGTARGLPIPAGFVGSVVSLGSSAVKQMIANEKKKYMADWRQGLNDLYFYNQLSSAGPFDPMGMQFDGFKIVRTFENNGAIDTALIVEFELDKSNPYQIINNSVFRLKVKSLKLNYAKAKVAPGSNTLNMDFEITFNTSYVNGDGELFKNMELGKFYFRLRAAPLDAASLGYDEYYKKLVGKKLEGWSFIVPRSYGYQIKQKNLAEPAYSQGAYTIDVNVKESSKNTFVNELLIDNSGTFIDELGGQIKKQFK